MGYLYKLIDLRSLTPSLSVLNVADPQKVAFERAGKIPWIHVSGDTTHREFFVNAGEYLFALRAVDALGGVEPFLEFRGNEGAQGNAFLTLASPHTEVLECDKAKLGEDRYWYNTLVAARAWNPASPALPDLEVDGDKVGPNWRNEGVPLTEAVIAPILSAGAEGFPGKLDCLYAYEAAGTVRDPDNQDARSYLQGTLCGTLWSNPDPDRKQGRIMWFGFPLYYMKTDQAQEVMNRAIDWFREENPLSP